MLSNKLDSWTDKGFNLIFIRMIDILDVLNEELSYFQIIIINLIVILFFITFFLHISQLILYR